jgi:hypothetical protein
MYFYRKVFVLWPFGRHILWSFGRFARFGMPHQEKSGKPAKN